MLILTRRVGETTKFASEWMLRVMLLCIVKKFTSESNAKKQM